MGKAEQTRQFIVGKIAPLFNIKGFSGTSLSDMTNAVGLTKGSLYGNFANKDELALAAFEHNWNYVRAVVREKMIARTTCKGKLLVFASLYGDLSSRKMPKGGCPLLNTATEADDTHPRLRKKAIAALQAWRSDIVALIKAGIAGKEFRADVDAERTALTLIALIEGSVMISRLTGDAKDAKAVMTALERTIRDLE